MASVLEMVFPPTPERLNVTLFPGLSNDVRADPRLLSFHSYSADEVFAAVSKAISATPSVKTVTTVGHSRGEPSITPSPVWCLPNPSPSLTRWSYCSIRGGLPSLQAFIKHHDQICYLWLTSCMSLFFNPPAAVETYVVPLPGWQRRVCQFGRPFSARLCTRQQQGRRNPGVPSPF